MRRCLLGVVIAALAWIPLAALGTANQAGAQSTSVTIDQIGWWTSRADASAAPGGFEVAAGFDGSTESLAAIQITIDSTSVRTLQIELTEAQPSGGDAGMNVCLTPDAWAPAEGGDLADAPEPNCASAVALELADGVWTADVASLAPNGGQVSLMVVPDYQPPTIIGLGMVVEIAGVRFQAVSEAATTTTTAAPPTPTTAFSPPPTTSSGPSPIAPPPSPTTTALAGDLSRSNLPQETIPTPPETDVDGDDDGDDEFFTLGPAEEFDRAGRPWIRLIVLVPLSALIGVGAVKARSVLALRTS